MGTQNKKGLIVEKGLICTVRCLGAITQRSLIDFILRAEAVLLGRSFQFCSTIILTVLNMMGKQNFAIFCVLVFVHQIKCSDTNLIDIGAYGEIEKLDIKMKNCNFVIQVIT